MFEKSESIALLSAALVAAQAEMPAVKFNETNKFLGNKYADLGAVIEATRPILKSHGLAVSHLVVGEGESIGVTTLLVHSSGEFIGSTATLLVGQEKGKSSAQVAGSIVSYLRRYSLGAILGLYTDEDNDGNSPPEKKEKQAPGSMVEAALAEGGVVSPGTPLPGVPAGVSSYKGKMVKLHTHSYPSAWGTRLIAEFVTSGKIDGGVPHLDGILQKLGFSHDTDVDAVVSGVSTYLSENKK